MKCNIYSKFCRRKRDEGPNKVLRRRKGSGQIGLQDICEKLEDFDLPITEFGHSKPCGDLETGGLKHLDEKKTYHLPVWPRRRVKPWESVVRLLLWANTERARTNL